MTQTQTHRFPPVFLSELDHELAQMRLNIDQGALPRRGVVVQPVVIGEQTLELKIELSRLEEYAASHLI